MHAVECQKKENLPWFPELRTHLVSVLRGLPGCVTWMGIKCSSWVSISAPSTGRTFLDPMGYPESKNVAISNAMVGRTAFVWWWTNFKCVLVFAMLHWNGIIVSVATGVYYWHGYVSPWAASWLLNSLEARFSLDISGFNNFVSFRRWGEIHSCDRWNIRIVSRDLNPILQSKFHRPDLAPPACRSGEPGSGWGTMTIPHRKGLACGLTRRSLLISGKAVWPRSWGKNWSWDRKRRGPNQLLYTRIAKAKNDFMAQSIWLRHRF